MSKKGSESPMTFFSFQDIMACVTGIMILVTLMMALDPLADEVNTSRSSAEAESAATDHAGAKKRLADAQQAITAATAALEEARARPQVTAEQLARMDKLLGEERSGLEAIQRVRLQADGDAQRREDRVIIIDREVALAQDKVRAIKADLADKALRSRVMYQTGVRETLVPLLLETTPEGLAVGELDAAGTPKRHALLGPDVADPLTIALKDHPKTDWYALLVVRAESVPAMNELRDALRSRGYEVGWQLWDASQGGFFDVPPEETTGTAKPGASP